ncbi:MAG: hypothetical protein K2L13_00965, partial [Opitutales bacterium]|nr:hypothetical protein [Opitutales bacterium]
MSDTNIVKFDTFKIDQSHKDRLKNLFYNLDGLDEFCFTCTSEEDMSQVALKKIFDAVYATQNAEDLGTSQDLLNLSLRYSTLDGTGKKITSISHQSDGTYKITAMQDAAPGETMATPEHALAHLAIHYYALAVCLEKAYVVMDIMTVQLEQIESLNREIEMNNEYLRLANEWYSEYYRSTLKEGTPFSSTDFSGRNVKPDGNRTLETYVRSVCGYSDFTTSELLIAQYDSEGNARKSDPSGQNFSNIDTVEQGNLTMISNAQEAIRMYGDKLSMKQQIATVRLQQLIQNFAACITICSQLCKIIGDYIRSITNNVK